VNSYHIYTASSSCPEVFVDSSLFPIPIRVKKKVSEYLCFLLHRIESTLASVSLRNVTLSARVRRVSRAKSISECVYDNETRSELRRIYPLPSTTGHLSGGTGPVEVPAITTDLQPSIPGATRLLTCESSTLQGLDADWALPQRPSLVHVRRNSSERHPSLNINGPSISIVSSFLLPEIPPEPWIPLSFLGEERLQVSDAATTIGYGHEMVGV